MRIESPETWPQRLSRRLPALLAAGLAVLPFALHAGTTSTTFGVSATVLAACSVTANNLAFGNYDPSSATSKNVNTTLSVTCTNGTTYNVRLGTGATVGATVTTRQMANGANRLNYGLYQDAALTQNWGQTDGVDTAAGTATGSAVGFTVYGAIPAQQYVPAATYNDTVTVTVSF